MSNVLEIPYRALQLVALALAPAFASPEPMPPVPSRVGGLAALSVVAMIAVIGAAVWMRRKVPTPEATAAVVFWVLTAVVCNAAAAWFRGGAAPLARGIWYVAPFLYGAIAATLATLAARFLGGSFKNKRTAATVVALAGGLLNIQSASEVFANESAMWRATLDRAPGHPRAIDMLSEEILADARGPSRALHLADVCLARFPDACACLALRAEARLRGGHDAAAEEDARRAIGQGCTPVEDLVVIEAEAMARSGRPEEAIRKLDEWPSAPPARADFARALAIAAQGDREAARVLAQTAAQAGRGAPAEALAGTLAAQAGDCESARRWLDPVVHADTSRGDAYYWLGKCDEREQKWDRAIAHFQDAARASPTLSDARHDLVVLLFRRGRKAEAQREARSYATQFPADPRGSELRRLVGD